MVSQLLGIYPYVIGLREYNLSPIKRRLIVLLEINPSNYIGSNKREPDTYRREI